MDIIFSLFIFVRRLIWFFTIVVLFVAVKRLRHHQQPPQDMSFAVFCCLYEWIIREFIYFILPIPNPFTLPFERRIVPLFLLTSYAFCAIMFSIQKHGGIKKIMRYIAEQFFESVHACRSLLVRFSEWRYFDLAQNILTICLIAGFLITSNAASLRQGLLFPSLLLLVMYSVRFIYQALSSVRKLLVFWLFSPFLLLPISCAVIKAGAKTPPALTFWFEYFFFVLLFILWWSFTACMADDDVAKLASAFISTITTIGTIGSNIVLVFAEQYIIDFFSGSAEASAVYSAIVIITNMIFLPLLSASLLASLAKDLQIYLFKDTAK
nr:hypothetical protein [Fournierella massiliensis]